MFSSFRLAVLAAVGLLILLPAEATAGDEPQTLAPIIVVGTLDPPRKSEPVLDQGAIRDLPTGNGSLNELLHLLPGLQLSEEYNSAASGGEIIPPTLSISGGKVYQNNFLIDGIGNNNLIDPAASGGGDLVNDAPGHPQERFLGSALVDKVILHDQNVPARFGNFSGGVVEATTRDPGREVEGEVSYRTTRHQWSRFHIGDADQDAFVAGGHERLQPKFRKNEYSATLSLPLTGKSGLLTSWRLFDSRIPLPYFLTSKAQERRQQSFFVKILSEVSPADRLDATLSTTPYREERFMNNVQGSDYVVAMTGLALQGSWLHSFASGELESSGAYRRSSNERRAPQHFFNWAVTDSKAWGRQVRSEFSVEGGFGTIEKIQQSFDLQNTLRLDAIRTGAIEHEVTSGIDFSQIHGSFERPETTYVYKGARLSPDIICDGHASDCVDHEQFFTTRTIYDAGLSRATISQVAWHVEDLLRYRQLELRPGLRFDYNDLMEETTLAPRFLASYDLSGRSSTIVKVGANRYYGGTLLTDKLREANVPFRSESRTSYQNYPTEWTAASAQGPNVTRFNRLRTPYADELSMGIEQRVGGGLLRLSYLQREGRDEFARSYSTLQADGLRYYTLNNLGESRHRRTSLAWQQEWSKHSIVLNASWQETTTTNENYDTLLEREEVDSRIWYDNRLIYRSDLPAQNQNRPVIVNLLWIAELPAHLTFTNESRYRSPYRQIVATGEFRPLPESQRRVDPLTGEEILDAVAVYETVSRPGKVIFDWRLAWSYRCDRRQILELSLEINNVFNSRLETGGSQPTYEMGRQFWAGVTYDF